MRRPQGYLVVAAPDAPALERDTIQCGHCQKIVAVKPGTASTVYMIPRRDGSFKEEPGAFCRVCMRPVCLPCHDIGTCTPFERQLERLEARR